MCNFQKLAFSEHGYVIRCIECGYYQVGFGTTMLTVNSAEFSALYELVAARLNEILVCHDSYLCDETKGIFIATPSPACCFVLTRKELQSLYDILDKADSEIKTRSLLQLFR